MSDSGEEKQRRGPLGIGDTVEELVSFTCPFCGGRVACTRPHGVLHELPPCQKFIDLDVVEYLRAARLERVKTN
jgi:hypothetical protein